MCYKELASICAGTGVCHAQNSGAIMAKRRIELVREGITGTAGSVSLRAAALDHEIVDDTVEIQSFIKVFTGILHVQLTFDKAHEIGYGHGNLLVFEAENDVSLLCIDYGIEAVSIFIAHF